MSEVAAAVAITEEQITRELEAGNTDILKQVSRWRVFALYANRKSWRWSLPEASQKALGLLIDNCNASL